MIKIKLSAQDVRTIRGAESLAELQGIRSILLTRIAEFERERAAASEKAKGSLAGGLPNWKQARAVLEGVLGTDLKAPPFPDPIWYQRVHRAIKMYGIDHDKLKEIAEYVKAHLKPPYSMDFIVCQHERILAGNYDSQVAKRGASSDATYLVNNWRKNNSLPEE